MRWEWIFLRSLIDWQWVSSKERWGWAEIKLEIEVDGGLEEQKHGGIYIWTTSDALLLMDDSV